MENSPNPKLDALLATRYGGAVNVRGIRYQLLYSVLRALDLYDPAKGVEAVQLEGVEDVDLLGLRVADQYVQVKTSEGPWQWSSLKGVLKNFVEVYRLEPRSRFELVIGASLRPSVRDLADYSSLGPKKRADVQARFVKLCRKIGATREEAKAVLDRLTLSHVPEDELIHSLRAGLATEYGLSSEVVGIYIGALTARFLDWAKDRQVIHRSDLERVRSRIEEGLARETEFRAYGKGLIDRISWDEDAAVDDFFDGKRARPGHVAAGLDVQRPKWLERIGLAVTAAKVCVLRSPSGQGKSTLLYRYAYENWPPSATFLLRVVESGEHVELIRNYLRFRASADLPTLLLLDDASWRTRLWPAIARECAAIGVPMLVSIRVEDWQRFARPDLANYELVEPDLDMDEARQLFGALGQVGRIHDSVDSAEWAYERIGKPHLLMEYVYFITHGRMLEERLREQIRQFVEHDEDPGKVELLRRVAMADVLGVHLTAEGLVGGVDLHEDPQFVLESMKGEYIDLGEGELVAGLHWVRSDHIARILHEEFRDPATTALAVFGAVPRDELPALVSNALERTGAPGAFLAGLREKAEHAPLSVLLKITEGLFEWGERRFFEANQPRFNEAHDLVGSAGACLLASNFMPVVKINVIDQMVGSLGDKAGGFLQLQSIAERMQQTERGLDWAKQFLADVTDSITAERLLEEPANAGRILDWLPVCDLELACWAEARDALVANKHIFEAPIADFCAFAQGLYRYDPQSYAEWFSLHEDDVLGYLRSRLDCVELDIVDRTVSIGFFPESSDSSSWNDQAVSRLKKLRAALPFCEHYRSKGIWTNLFGLAPSVDDTVKNMPAENLPFESDIDKNVVWRDIAQRAYLPDSYYRYQQCWYELRRTAVLFVQRLGRVFIDVFAGREARAHQALQEGELPVKLGELLKDRSEPPPQAPQEVADALKSQAGGFAQSLQNFLKQFFDYAQEPTNAELGRIALHNLRDAATRLPEMHAAFAALLGISPDYFGMADLASKEGAEYAKLGDLIEEWISGGIKRRRHDVLADIRSRKEREEKRALDAVEEAIASFEESGTAIVIPGGIHTSYPLTYLPLAFSVADPCFPEESLVEVVRALQPVRDVANFFWLVPVWQGARFMNGGYRVGGEELTRLAPGDPEYWESLVPCDVPPEILEYLPNLPSCDVPRLHIRSSVLALLAHALGGSLQEQAIAPLASAENPFDKELFARHKDRLQRLLGEAAEVASVVARELDEVFRAGFRAAELRLVEGFLNGVSQAAQEEGGFRSVLRSETEAVRVAEALNGALRGRIGA